MADEITPNLLDLRQSARARAQWGSYLEGPGIMLFSIFLQNRMFIISEMDILG